MTSTGSTTLATIKERPRRWRPSRATTTVPITEPGAPAAKPLPEVGQSISAGEPLCIIEAMKLMNEIEADATGVIKAILVENGEPVEYGEPLFIIG